MESTLSRDNDNVLRHSRRRVKQREREFRSDDERDSMMISCYVSPRRQVARTPVTYYVLSVCWIDNAARWSL